MSHCKIIFIPIQSLVFFRGEYDARKNQLDLCECSRCGIHTDLTVTFAYDRQAIMLSIVVFFVSGALKIYPKPHITVYIYIENTILGKNHAVRTQR